MKRILSVALALLLVLGLLPVANAAELSEFGKIKEQEYVSGGERGSASSTSNNDMKNGKLFDAAPDVDVEEPKDTDIVSIIVELDGEPAMAVSESVKSASAAEAKLLEKQNLLQAEIENALGVKLDVKHNYTLLYNGFSFEGEYSLVKKIRDLGVNVYVSPEFEVPKMHTSVGLIGADIAWDYGYTGEGQTVAIIDTGIRLTHEAFSVVPENIAWTQETLQALVSAAGSNLNAGNNVSQLYKSGKIPFAYNYYSNNYNPGHGSSDHGSHVAGIAAGNNGSDFKGVAPDAQLVVMQVFTPMGGAYWSEILAALEDCAYLGVGAANMSLGSSCGFTDYNGDSTYERVLGLVADAGVNLSVAAGNDGATYEGNHWEGRQLASNPDYGVVGSPATFPESLCVAASNNLGGSEGVVEAYGESFAYNDRSGDPAVAFSTLNGEQEYVVVPGLGNPSDFTGIDVTGKIALIVRGEINFSDKVANAYQAGAIGVIIYNNEAGVINMAVDNYFVPAVSITQVAGQHLVNNATNGIGTLTVSGMDATGTPTAFSSRGTTADLKIKPEIMAPGANINSVDGFTSNSSYKLSDGTSMAAPHVAGGMAIVQEYVDEMFPNADESRKMELVDAILMSTAIPRVDGNGNPFVVREQGAGMMNLGNALTTTAYLSVSDNVRPKLEVGSSENGVFELNFTVNNFGDTALTYTINPIVITETPKVLGEYGGETVYYIDGTPYALNDVVELDMPESVTVPAGGTADVSVTVTLTDAAKTFFADHFDAGMFVEGFVELEGVADGEGAIPSTLNIPFLGFYGDWNHPAMIEEGAYYYQDEPTYSQVRENLIGYKAGSQIQGLGINPYVDMTEAQFLADRGAVSPNGDGWFESINVAYINLMRNASYAEYAVEINGSSTVLSRGTYVKKGHMPDGDPYQQMGYNYMSFPTWNASALTEGQSAVIKIRADLANEGYTTEANANGVWEVPVTKDLTAPEIVSVEVIEGGVRITFTDAHYVAYAKVYGNNDVYYDNGIFENERGANTTIDVMTTEPQVVLFLGDYAANESEYTINTATGEYEGGGQIDPPGPVETILYEWGFEDISEVAEWLTADADGDGQEWTLFRDASGEIPYEGTGFLGSYSYLNNVGPLTPDNWTITQNLTLPDDADEISLKYFIRGVDDTYFAENYSVYVGPANPSNTGQFTRLFGETIATAGWNEKVVDLSAYAGQTITIAFRHHGCTDQYTLALDNMSIVSTTGDEPPVTPTPVIPTPTPDLPGEGFVETNEIIPGEQYIIAVDYNGQIMMMSNVLDTDTNIRLVGDPAQMSGNAIVGGYSDNHLWTFSSETAGTIQSVGNGRYCEVVTHNGYAWLGLADSASYNWTWDGNGNMVTDAPSAGQWNHLSYAETATDIDHPAFDLWVYGEPDYLPIKLYKASGDVPPVTPTPDVTPTPPPVGENVFEESFENGLGNWTLIDADGDGYNWMDSQTNPWEGTGYDGMYAAYSSSYVNGSNPFEPGTVLFPDNWMISQEFTVPAENAVLSWYHSASDPNYNEENYSVYVGNGTDPSGYTEVVYNGYPTNTEQGEYQNVTVDLSAYAGQTVQLAFRHHDVSDMYMLVIDYITVSGEGDVPPVTPTPEVTPTPPPVGENAFEDSFENGLVNWTLVDADNDGNNWMGTYNTGWSGELPAQDGSEAAFSQSFINYVGPLTPDNWMISTEFTVPAEDAVLSWYHSASDVEWNEENYSVYVGHGNDPSGYTEVVYNGYPTNTVQGEYQNVTVDLSAYAGQDIQIAFRHHNVSDMYILLLDNVVVSGAGDVPPVTPTPDVTPTPPPAGDLDEALNVEGGTLTFTNDEVYPWEVRDNYAASGNAGVVSSSSTVTTTVELAEGEALYFDWSVSSESGWDKLIFSVDGTAVRNISGEVDWTQFYYVAPAAGTYTFTWSYTKDGSVDRNNDEGYLDNVYVGEAPEVPEADMYAFNSFEESWITFNSADPSMAAPVGAPGATVFAAEYVDGTVYGYTNDGRFFTTTLSNMSNLNVVGTIGEVIVDMAYNYANDTMYAIGTSDNQAGPRSLHTVDLETGALTLVGSLEDTAVAAIMTLGITTEGEAYGISFAPGNQTNDSYLHTINLETAECEAIGPTGFPINYVQTMAYDHNNDQMLWAQFYSDGMFTQTSALVAVNLETGAGTQLGSTPVGGEVGELLGMFSVPGEGPTPPPADYTIEVGTVEANQGDRVFVPVSMDNLSSGSFTIEYDADALTYITHTNPVDDTFIVVNDWTPGILQIAVVNPIANYEGECMTLEFAVAADAEGTYALDLTVNDGASIVDEITVAVAGEDIEAIDGAIEVVLGYTVTFNYMVDGEWVSESQTVAVGEAAIAPEALPQAHEITQLILLGWDVDFSAVYSDLEVTAEYGLLGDVYTDEELNVSDALLIMRSVAGMESLSEIQELLGDVDQDGDVTIVDALYLVRLIVGAESFNG